VRAEFPDATIIAGNVVTGEMTEELILSGGGYHQGGHWARLSVRYAQEGGRWAPAIIGHYIKVQIKKIMKEK